MRRSVWSLAVYAQQVALAALLSGCVPVQVTTETTPGASLSGFESFAQDALPAVPEEDATTSPRSPMSPTSPISPKLRERIQSEIATVLEAKGYQRRPASEADLTVRFQVTARSSVRMVNAADPDTDFDVPEQFAEGTLVVSVFEADGNEQLWRGIGDTEVMTAGALIRGDPEKAMIESVRKVLAKFPDARPGER